MRYHEPGSWSSGDKFFKISFKEAEDHEDWFSLDSTVELPRLI